MKVAILVSTYNGEKFLEVQLQSLLKQDYKDLDIYIRDDGSIDKTNDVIEEYSQKYENINWVQDNLGNLGPTKAFFNLLQIVDADIYFFCDQDDYWLPDKVSKTIECFGTNSIPLLVHSDLTLVDQNLAELGKTFNENELINIPLDYSANMIFLQNCAVGCTVALNSLLKRLVLKEGYDSSKLVMHDWWVLLVALYFGKVIYIDTPTIYYRQHGGNVSGTTNKKMISRFYNLISFRWTEKISNYIVKTHNQLTLFLELYGHSLDKITYSKLKKYSDLYGIDKPWGFLVLICKGFRFKHMYMNILVLSCMLRKKMINIFRAFKNV